MDGMDIMPISSPLDPACTGKSPYTLEGGGGEVKISMMGLVLEFVMKETLLHLGMT